MSWRVSTNVQMANVICSMLLITVFHTCVFVIEGVSLNERTREYEIIRIDETYDVRRDVVRRISFTAFGRSYVALLTPSSDAFNIHSRIKIGDSIATSFDGSHNYRGYLEENPRYTVVVSRLWPSVYIGTVFAGHDSISLEPASPHFPAADDRDVLVLRSNNISSSFFSHLGRDGVSVPLQVIKRFLNRFFFVAVSLLLEISYEV
ncbi:hypothetical protein OESDEN_00529 [Oesophagostomum dentatum]|uniref:Uncharacterized protein n=1 Tax=Oesophagostomum dentatum TaxID=61180 RepID=A0A0B1TPL7_OESDE|nr:hypothetical protein OESDEN_00529 [Oesophagostomum dentatum]